MSFVMKEDKTPDPVDIGFFCRIGIVFDSEAIANLIEQFRLIDHYSHPTKKINIQ